MGIPVFFYISGAASAFGKVQKFHHFFINKFLRLIVPMLICVPIFLWPRNYLDQGSEGLIDGKKIHNPFTYFIAMCKDLFNQLSWLWFLVALFLVMCAEWPFLYWVQRRKNEETIDKWDYLTILAQLVAVFTLAGMAIVVDNYKNVCVHHLLPATAIQFGGFLLYFAIAMRPEKSYLGRAVAPVICLLMDMFKKNSTSENYELFLYFLSFNYYMNFFAVGHLDMKFERESGKAYVWFRSSLLQPLTILLGLMGYAICLPMSSDG